MKYSYPQLTAEDWEYLQKAVDFMSPKLQKIIDEIVRFSADASDELAKKEEHKQ